MRQYVQLREERKHIKRAKNVYIRLIAILVAALPVILVGTLRATAEEQSVWEQVAESFFTNAGLAIEAHNGQLLQATRLADSSGRLGVVEAADGSWQPFGPYPVSGLNGLAPALFMKDGVPHLVYDNTQKVVVRRYETIAKQWIQVGSNLPVSYSLKTAIDADEDGTLYIAYLNGGAGGKNDVHVKKLADDGEGNVQWTDVGSPDFFADRSVYGEQKLVLRVHEGKVYVAYMSYMDPDPYRPKVFVLDQSAENPEWVALEGNTNKLAPATGYDRDIFAFELVNGVPYAVSKEFSNEQTFIKIKMYQGGEWITVNEELERGYYWQLAEYNGMLYYAYSETSDFYEAGDWKVWLKRLDGGQTTIVGSAPVLASTSQLLQLADLAFDEVERIWYAAIKTAGSQAVVMRLADDLQADAAPTLTPDEVKSPDEAAAIAFPDGDGVWREAVQYVRNGAALLAAGEDYALAEGKLTVYAHALHAGVNQIGVTSAGYANASVVQLVRPKTPTDVQPVKVGYGYIDVAWAASPDADAYLLDYIADGAAEPESVQVDATDTSYRLIGLNAEKAYTLSVKARKDGVESAPALSVSAAPRLVPDGFGKAWSPVGGTIDGVYPDIEAAGGDLWIASRDDSGISAHRYTDGGWELVGPARFARSNGLRLDIEADEEVVYVAYTDYYNDGKMAVSRRDGSQWLTLGGGAFSEGSPVWFSLIVHEGTPYVAYSEVFSFSGPGFLRVKKFAEDAGSGAPGWVELWETQAGMNTGAVSLREHDNKLYLAYADSNPTLGYRIFLHSLDLEAGTSAWQDIPGEASLKPGYWGDLGFDLDEAGNLYVSFRTNVWKYTAADEVWIPLGMPSDYMNYSHLSVIDGQPIVAYSDEDRIHVWKYANEGWYRVGDSIIAYSGQAAGPLLANRDGRPVLIHHNGYGQTELREFVYDTASVVLHRGDGSEPEQRTVRIGEPLASLDELSREDYEFLGWFDGDGEPFAFRTTPIVGDLSLFAHWKLMKPETPTAEPGNRAVTLAWTPIGAATKYKVYAAERADLVGAQTVETEEAALSVDGLTNGTMYYFAVQAFDDDYESDRSEVVSAVPMTVPEAPRNVSATEGDRRITVAFEASADDGGSDIASYHVYLDGERKWSGTDLSATIAGLANRQTYEITVTAENGLGESLPSSPAVEARPHRICQIYWMLRDDTDSSTESIVCGDSAVESVPAERAGYHFEGWYDYYSGEPYDFSAAIEYGAVIAARWSLVPERLPANEWNVLNDLSDFAVQLSSAAYGDALYTAKLVAPPDYTFRVAVERYTRENGWEEIGRFAEAGFTTGIAVVDGAVYVLFDQMDLTSYTSYLNLYRRDADSGTWDELFRIEMQGGGFGASNLGLTFERNGGILAKYDTFDESFVWRTYALAYTPDEDGIVAVEGLIADEGLAMSGNSTFLAHDDELYFAYADDSRLLHVKRRDAAGWMELGSLASFGEAAYVPTIQLAWHNGKLLLVYPAMNDGTRILAWDGTEWSALPAIDAASPVGAAVYADDRQGLFAVYSRSDGTTNEELLSLKTYANGVWTQIGPTIDPNGSAVANLRIGVDRLQPHITYTNGENAAVLRRLDRPVCTVTVDRLAGAEAESVWVPCGEQIDEPTLTARAGYTLDGWSASSSAEQAWHFADPVTSDMTLAPIWRWNYAGMQLPVDLTATEEDGRTVLNWVRLDAVSEYALFLRKAEEIYEDTPYRVVALPEEIQSAQQALDGLEGGTAYAAKIVAYGEEGERAESAEIAFTSPDNPQEPEEPQEPVNPQQPSVPPQGETQETEERPTGIDVFVNGLAQPIGRASSIEEEGRKVSVIHTDEQKLLELLQAEPPGATIVIPAADDADAVRGALNGAIVKAMEMQRASLELRTPRAIYRLPAELLQVDAMLEQLAAGEYAELEYTIEIADATDDQAQAVRNAVASSGGTALGDPVVFTVQVFLDDKPIRLERFAAYSERLIAIPADIDPGRVTTAVVVEPDGSLRHVPTRIIAVDGIYYAVVNSLTNSVYTLIDYRAALADIVGHWAEADILDLGNRRVVHGRDGARFAPGDAVTRAEFAAMAVRALGLKRADGQISFADDQAAGMLAPYLRTAVDYGLLQGYADGALRPEAPITREQVMVMTARAMGMIASDTAPVSDVALPFIDADEVSPWAEQAVRALYEADLVNGDDRGRLSPRANVTRAEAVAILRRLLQHFALI